jgi:hypothetical protein
MEGTAITLRQDFKTPNHGGKPATAIRQEAEFGYHTVIFGGLGAGLNGV